MNWLKYRKYYFTLSFILIGISTFSLTKWKLPLGIDFKGGSVIEYYLEKNVSTEDIISKVEENGIGISVVQSIGENSYLLKMGQIASDQRESIRVSLSELTEGEVREERFENVGPSIGPELIKKTLYAILISAFLITLWVAMQFKSFKFGISAILAMFHDSFILIGFFALLGHFFDAEVDFLFVTALLTTLSFSVHDTIVVYDRIREIRKKHGGEISDIANQAVGETMRRSINNSVTIALMLLSLLIFGGTTIRWFAAALLIGTILGTYSSPFIAVPLLVTWEQIYAKLKK